MNDVLQILMDIRGGQLANRLNEKFNEVLDGVRETAGVGTLTLKLKISPSKLGKGGAVIETKIEHDLKTTRPELQIGAGVFFVTEDGTLTRDDPAQTALFEEAQSRAEVKK